MEVYAYFYATWTLTYERLMLQLLQLLEHCFLFLTCVGGIAEDECAKPRPHFPTEDEAAIKKKGLLMGI